jgi:hypothetical protein
LLAFKPINGVLVSLVSTLLVSFRSRLALQAEILALCHQLNVLRRSTHARGHCHRDSESWRASSLLRAARSLIAAPIFPLDRLPTRERNADSSLHVHSIIPYSNPSDGFQPILEPRRLLSPRMDGPNSNRMGFSEGTPTGTTLPNLPTEMVDLFWRIS